MKIALSLSSRMKLISVSRMVERHISTDAKVDEINFFRLRVNWVGVILFKFLVRATAFRCLESDY